VKANKLEEFQRDYDCDWLQALARAILLDQVTIHTKMDAKGNEYKQIKVTAFKDE
jgi:hypothetical protein